MKRITEACICQTVTFKPKEDIERTEAIKLMMKEANDYKDFLGRIQTPYKVVQERVDEDGAVVLEIRKKYGRYNMGKYLE